MHGQPRRAPRPEDAAAAAAKAAALRDLQSQLLSNHKNRIYTKEALATSSKLLDMNPETYTAWNYRKLAVRHNLNGREQDLEAVKSAVDDELRVVEMALMRNPKAYGAWYHRKWVLSMGICLVDFDREFRLLDKLLKVDARNFHGWNYRRFLAKLKNVAEEEELKFTKKMIDTNFSNYSAWHNRSVVLSRLLTEKASGFEAKENILTEEYELVSDALFTDPNDQSGWFYHMWLLDQTIHVAGVQLVTSWPSSGSNLFLSTTNKAYGLEMVASMDLNTHYVSNTRKFPIILCFSDAVKDVNTTTIRVCARFVNNEDLIWRPLSAGKVEEARCWMTLVNVPDTKCNSSSTYEIEVSFGQSNETMTSDSFLHCSPSQFTFTATINYDNLEETEDDYTKDIFLWNSDNSCGPQENTDSTLEELNFSEDLFPEGGSKWSVQTLLNEINRFKELLDDDDSKFVKLTLARLLVAPDAMNSCKTLLKQKKERTNVVLNLYSELILLDPPHRKYYEDERSLVLMDQFTSDKEALSNHMSRYKQSSCSGFQNFAYLQLNNLSLTRIGSVEQLLWVQILDLSHNKLHNITGLEALQLLVCLNLSNNKITSFTALEPLKQLSFLRVLDVSFNEIGSHTIDTTRHLCLSPLSNTVDKNQVFNEYLEENIGLNWEVILFLMESQLTQLAIKGNAIDTQKFQQLALKLLPTLKWLDGEQLR